MSDDDVVREVESETRESIGLLEQNRLDRPEKRRREEVGDRSAARVEFAEREFRKRRPETLQEIQRLVDAMGTGREDRLRVGDRVFLPPEEALPPTRVLTDLERKAIERHLGGKVVRASIIYRSARGHVVEVEHEKEGARATTLLSVLGERVRDLDRIRERVDSLEPRRAPPPAPEPEPAAPTPPEPETAAPPEPAPAEAAPSAPEPAAAEEPAEEAPAEAKKRFGLPKLGKGKRKDEPTEPAEVAEGDAVEKTGKKGLGRFLRRK